MNEVIFNSLKSYLLGLTRFTFFKHWFINAILIRKSHWMYRDMKKTLINAVRNIRKFYVPSLKLSKGNQIKDLFDKIDIDIPEKGFVYSIDEFKTLDYECNIIGNISVDYSKILENSLGDLRLNYQGSDEYSTNQLQTLDAIGGLINRQIDQLDASGRADRNQFIEFFENIKVGQANSFKEALQRILFFNQILWQTGHGLNGFGRLDKVLNDIYEKDMISKQEALELIKDFLVAANSSFYYKSAALPGDTGQIIVIGGKEESGEYFANDLSYLFLRAVSEMHLPDPKIILRYSENIPRDLMELSLECMATGVGSPLISNDDLIIQKLIDFGYDSQDAYNYVVSACWEPAPVKKGFEMNNIATIVFLSPLNNLLDNEDLSNVSDFDSFLELYEFYLGNYVQGMIDAINRNMNWEKDPLLSLFIDDCDDSLKDLSEGGAVYNNFGLTSVSLSNTVNSLLNIKKLVFDENKYGLIELNDLRKNNFPDSNLVKDLRGHGKKFGMDDAEVIGLTNEIVDCVNEVFKKSRNSYGGGFKFGLSSPAHISSSGITASLDGRRDFEPFDVHISLDNNKDYTELMRFASKLNYDESKFNGNVVDFLASPDFINRNFDKFVDFLMLSMNMGVFQMQMNVVDSKMLIDAKNNPQNYPNLIVRVWGFSAYFTDLPPSYQDLLIKRAIENEGKNN